MVTRSGGQRAGGSRGLPTLNEARAERRRALVYGKVKLRGELSPRFWLWAAVILSATLVIYWKLWQGRLASQKAAVMAKQRAVAQTLEPQVVPQRDQIEKWVMEFSGAEQPKLVLSEITPDLLNSQPSIYLRLRLANGKDRKSIRKAASVSLLDGFTSCLFVRKGEPDPSRGPECLTSADCDPGLLCNEYHVCLPPPKPYNMRLAYQALRVLTPEWSDELHEASSELEVKAFERTLERVAEDDVPIAVRMMDRAKFFTLVLDEDPKGGLPESLDDEETEEQRVQRAVHRARVGIWNLSSGKQLLRLRATAGGRLVAVGKSVPHDPRIVAAQKRQANSCALALAVKEALTGESQLGTLPPRPAGASPPAAGVGSGVAAPSGAPAVSAAPAASVSGSSP